MEFQDTKRIIATTAVQIFEMTEIVFHKNRLLKMYNLVSRNFTLISLNVCKVRKYLFRIICLSSELTFCFAFGGKFETSPTGH
jgi:hypothetical protein